MECIEFDKKTSGEFLENFLIFKRQKGFLASMNMNRKDVYLLLREWKAVLHESRVTAIESEVEVIFPDSIDKDLLVKGDNDREISGFVYPDDSRRLRGGIYWKGELVGFMTPREEKGGWRVGAIYIDSEARERVKGIGSIAISKFFEDREAANLLIGVDNISSQRAFSNAGFEDTGKKYVDDSDGWEATVWSRELGVS